TKKGFLRVLLVREAKRTSERMVVLITSDGEFDGASFVEAVRAVYPAKSIQRGIFRGFADVAAAEEVEVLYGPDTIDDCLCIRDGETMRQYYFRISPFSFFQTNTFGTERLYGLIRQWAKTIQPDILYDLYGGTGGIAFTCADLAREIVSVETVVSATQDGIFNAERNGVSNVQFLTDTVEHYLKDVRSYDSFPPGSAVVIDPPRPGLHPKALQRLVRLCPENLLCPRAGTPGAPRSLYDRRSARRGPLPAHRAHRGPGRISPQGLGDRRECAENLGQHAE
ncbi:MAG: hypothetical protein NTU83_02540, partial [Candidatus Hydrogenedentes bacterium]|nr:hypothetical protein [Candidatus Hydrogenedentota bacterium]